MSQMEENNVYMILYNYQDADYSVIKIMSTLQKALMYIHQQEMNEYTDIKELTLVSIDKEKDIVDKCKEDCCNVCLFSNNDSYLSKNFCDVEHISPYIIVRNIVE
jgi:hypothetical protein